jgi:adenine-specific DNA-methyltransferase
MSPPRKGAKAPAGPVAVDSIDHRDGRANIPTGELRDFVADDEVAPPEGRYERRIIDPELVWRGKDALDAAELVVPSVPVYIQETVHPRAIIENLRDTAGGGADEPELTLFDDLYEPEFGRRVEFYEHEERWKNRLVLGDSLLVMTSLAERERLRGKVQMIYMDPPYGIRFQSNWQVSTRKRDVKDGKVADATRQPEQVKAFRDTWEDGIHTYLTYLRDRLTVARELLTDSGSLFVQIGDENVHLVRSLLDEVFGAENFISQVPFKKTSAVGSFAGGTTVLASTCDYLVWFARDRDRVRYRQLFRTKAMGAAGAGAYGNVRDDDGGERKATRDEIEAGRLASGRFFRPSPLTSETVREGQTTVFPVQFRGRSYLPGSGGWKTNKAGMDRLRVADRLTATGSSLSFVRYLDDFPAFPLTNFWEDTQSGSGMDKVYVVQTNTKVVQRCLLMTTDPGDLVLDPTCGSGTRRGG